MNATPAELDAFQLGAAERYHELHVPPRQQPELFGRHMAKLAAELAPGTLTGSRPTPTQLRQFPPPTNTEGVTPDTPQPKQPLDGTVPTHISGTSDVIGNSPSKL